MGSIFTIIYMIAGYWAVGETIYADKVVIYTGTAFFLKKLALGFMLGLILIPVAVIKKIFVR